MRRQEKVAVCDSGVRFPMLIDGFCLGNIGNKMAENAVRGTEIKIIFENYL